MKSLERLMLEEAVGDIKRVTSNTASAAKNGATKTGLFLLSSVGYVLRGAVANLPNRICKKIDETIVKKLTGEDTPYFAANDSLNCSFITNGILYVYLGATQLSKHIDLTRIASTNNSPENIKLANVMVGVLAGIVYSAAEGLIRNKIWDERWSGESTVASLPGKILAFPIEYPMNLYDRAKKKREELALKKHTRN